MSASSTNSLTPPNNSVGPTSFTTTLTTVTPIAPSGSTVYPASTFVGNLYDSGFLPAGTYTATGNCIVEVGSIGMLTSSIQIFYSDITTTTAVTANDGSPISWNNMPTAITGFDGIPVTYTFVAPKPFKAVFQVAVGGGPATTTLDLVPNAGYLQLTRLA